MKTILSLLKRSKTKIEVPASTGTIAPVAQGFDASDQELLAFLAFLAFLALLGVVFSFAVRRV